LALTDFAVDNRARTGRRSSCRKCTSAIKQRARVRERLEREQQRHFGSPRTGTDWTREAEQRLFPGRSYHELSSEERSVSIALAREMAGIPQFREVDHNTGRGAQHAVKSRSCVDCGLPCVSDRCASCRVREHNKQRRERGRAA
jgi:hypothetical protein